MKLPPGPPKRFAHTSYCSGCQGTVHGSCSSPELAHTPANIQGMLNSDPIPAKNSVRVISGKYPQGLGGGGWSFFSLHLRNGEDRSRGIRQGVPTQSPTDIRFFLYEVCQTFPVLINHQGFHVSCHRAGIQNSH